MTPNSELQTPSPPTWFRGFVQGKTRIVLAWIFAVWLIYSARISPSWPGILLCFLGASLRYWASGFLRKDSRPAVGGPYAFVRNPLYLGTYLMAVGTALAIENLLLALVLSLVFFFIYHYIILDEETKLVRIFGEPYENYCDQVPRFFPSLFQVLNPGQWRKHATNLLSVNPEPTHHQFSKELARKNKAYEAYLTFAALIFGVWIAAQIRTWLGF